MPSFLWREKLERATGFEPATYGLGSRRSTPELHPPASYSRTHSRWNQPDGMCPVNHASEATRVSQMTKPQAVPSFREPLQCQGRCNVPCAEPLAGKPPEVRSWHRSPKPAISSSSVLLPVAWKR